jgi:hypothetical protein
MAFNFIFPKTISGIDRPKDVKCFKSGEENAHTKTIFFSKLHNNHFSRR